MPRGEEKLFARRKISINIRLRLSGEHKEGRDNDHKLTLRKLLSFRYSPVNCSGETFLFTL